MPFLFYILYDYNVVDSFQVCLTCKCFWFGRRFIGWSMVYCSQGRIFSYGSVCLWTSYPLNWVSWVLTSNFQSLDSDVFSKLKPISSHSFLSALWLFLKASTWMFCYVWDEVVVKFWVCSGDWAIYLSTFCCFHTTSFKIGPVSFKSFGCPISSDYKYRLFF